MLWQDGKMATAILLTSLFLSSSAFGLALASTLHESSATHLKGEQSSLNPGELQKPILSIHHSNELAV